MVRKRPVTGDLKIRRTLLHFCEVVPQIFAKRLAMELGPFKPVFILRSHGDLFDASLLGERPPGLFAIIDNGGPALTIDPHAVDAIVECQLEKLWNQQLIDVRAKYRRFLPIGCAVWMDNSPLRMVLDRLAVPDSRIVHVERHTASCGNLAPDLERVPHEAAGLVSHFRRIAGVSGVPLAVNLDVVRLHHVEDLVDHFRSRVLTDVVIVGLGMEVEMKPQEAVSPLQSRWISSREFGRRHRNDAYKQQRDDQLWPDGHE